MHLHVINSASKRKKQHQKLNLLDSSQHPAFPKLPLCWVNFQCQGLEGRRYHRGACRLPMSQRPPDWTRCTERSEGRERTEGSREAHGGHQKTKEISVQWQGNRRFVDGIHFRFNYPPKRWHQWCGGCFVETCLKPGWWFQIFWVFTPGGNDPSWLFFSNGLKPQTRFAFSGELGLTKNGPNMNKQGLFVGRWGFFQMVLTLPCVCGRWDIQKNKSSNIL